MRFIATWTFTPEHSKAVAERFIETGGAPPAGVTMLARYHDASGRRGWAILETEDPVAASTWSHQWSDLMSFEVAPVLDDQELGQVLGAGQG